jgi:membrane-associated phospholipid phosphatase
VTAPRNTTLLDGAVAEAPRDAGDPATAPGQRQHPGHLRDTWPVHRRQTAQLVGGWLALTMAWIGLGKVLTGPLADSRIIHSDRRVANWMVAHRTPTWNHLTVLGSYLAETITKVTVTAILALVFLMLWKRWFEPVVLVLSLVIEAAAFIVVTTVVGRDRPDVPRLDSSPVGSSFPSGHTAAAAAYIAIAVVVFWHTRMRWARVVVLMVTALIPVVVAASRIYRGMHFLSDTIAGAVLGVGAVLLTVVVLRRSPEAVGITDSSREPVRLTTDPGRSSTESVPSRDGAPIG